MPVINENDTVATAEIRYGDNDRLAARVAQMVGADCLVLLSDIDGLYTAESAPATRRPSSSRGCATSRRQSRPWPAAPAATMGSGGMQTKIAAAKIAVGGRLPPVHRRGARTHIR